MTDQELKRLQEKRLELLQNIFYHTVITLGVFAIICKILIIAGK